MSKADEMFEELGYEKYGNEVNSFEIMYKKNNHEITFYREKKFFDCGCGIGREFINMQELQAINEKVKELGWFGRKCVYCGEIITKERAYKFCSNECFKAYRKEYNETLRENNIEAYRQYQRNYRRNRKKNTEVAR